MASWVDREGVINLRGCQVATGEEGRRYIWNLAQMSGRKVTAFDTDVYYRKWPIPFTHIPREVEGPDYRCEGNLWLASPGTISYYMGGTKIITREDWETQSWQYLSEGY